MIIDITEILLKVGSPLVIQFPPQYIIEVLLASDTDNVRHNFFLLKFYPVERI